MEQKKRGSRKEAESRAESTAGSKAESPAETETGQPRALVATEEAARARPVPCAIVGIGASAGGLDAFTQLLRHLPPDSGLAFVLIQHLDASQRSFLPEALGKATLMPVRQVQHGERVQADRVYVIPPDADVSLEGEMLILSPRTKDASKPISRLHLPIDFFFAALAAERRNRAIGVVLTGTASDGTEGLRAIKAEAGITLAQSPGSAKFDGMPRSAIDAGVVDHVLPLPALADELVRLGRHPYVATLSSPPAAPAARRAAGGKKAPRKAEGAPEEFSRSPEERAVITRIMNVIETVVGVDFTEYKSPTFERRLARRMALRKIGDRESYLALLQGNPDEVRALYEDTLIHVSSFFRDPEIFETLKQTVFPELLKHKNAETPFRIWVAGCSTGEEVYSITLALLEFLGDAAGAHPMQVFGSDISDQAIQVARAGKYTDGAMRGMSDERRRRFFTRVDLGYRINKSVRDVCVFVRHDLAQDPPFSRLDMVSCRNVLIYFDQPLQKRVLSTFHYSLNQPGFLLLGRTEHISGFEHLFSAVDKDGKLFARSSAPSGQRHQARRDLVPRPPSTSPVSTTGAERRPLDLGRHLDRLLLARYAPPGVLVNEKMEILQFRGRTGSYLQPAPGEPQNNLVKMARTGLLATLQATLARSRSEVAPARADGVEVDQDGFTRTCNIVVLPFAGLPELSEPLFVVLFEEVGTAGVRMSPYPAGITPLEADEAEHHARRIPKLEHELSATTQYLHALIEEHDRASDDLGSANEELVSGNEELQSLNEELETAKEELQSTNEELTTVNDELNHRNLEVNQINNDLVNLLDTVDVPVVILDKLRQIRRFTPRAQDLMNLLPSDVGRLFDDIKPKIDVQDLDRQIADVIATFTARETEVRDRTGRWYRMQIRPYKKSDGSVDGAIVSLFDIDALKHSLRQAQSARDEAERADHAKDEFLAVLSHELRTPLSALLLQAQLLRLVGADPAKRERACEAIERSTKMQVQLIDDLLDVSRIVVGKMRVKLLPVDLASIIEATLEIVAVLAERKSIQLSAAIDHTLSAIAGDRVRLEQVVSNLLTNAIKFTPEGGRVEVSLERAGEQAHLRVRDTGRGIEPSFLPRIFNRLTQEDSSSTRAHAGLGLGLAIVRHLVEAHGGQVWVESPGSGKGATFHVTFPFLSAEPTGLNAEVGRALTAVPAEIGRAGNLPAGRLSGRRILVVEDDAAIREALAEMLSQTGAQVKTAESAAEGMAIFLAFRPEVLLCDIAMPGEDGYAFLGRIRALGATEGGDTPALALTALVGGPARVRALSRDAFQRYLAKPIDMTTLAEVIAEVLENPAPLLT